MLLLCELVGGSSGFHTQGIVYGVNAKLCVLHVFGFHITATSAASGLDR